MRKAVKTSLVVVLMSAMAGVAYAQISPAQTAEEEAVRRQDAIRELHLKVEDAQRAEKKGRIDDAAKLYQGAVDLFPKIGEGEPPVEADKAVAVEGLVHIRLDFAQKAQEKGDLAEADRQIKSALKVAPKNESLIAFKEANDKAIVAQQGNIPSQEVVARIPEFRKERIKSNELVHDGKVLLDAGKLDEAEAKFKQALVMYPQNTAATYYLDVAKETRYRVDSRLRDAAGKQAIVDVEKEWLPPSKGDLLPQPNMMARTNLVYTSEGRQAIMAKLDRIHLNEVFYDGIPLGEVMKKLHDESVKRDPDKVGINFMINSRGDGTPASTDPSAPAPPPVDLSTVTVKISPALNDMRLADALDAITKVADQPITYSIENYAVVFMPRPAAAQNLITKQFRVNPNTFVQGLQGVSSLDLSYFSTGSGQGGSSGGAGGGGGFGGGSQGGQSGGNTGFTIPIVNVSGGGIGGGGGRGGGGGIQGGGIGGQQGFGGLEFVTRTNTTLVLHEMVRTYFTTAGVDLSPPKNVFFNDRAGILMVHATEDDINIIRQAIEVLNQAPPQVTIEAKFAEITQTDSKALGFDWILGNTTFGSGAIGASGGPGLNYGSASGSSGTFANPTGIFPLGTLPTAGTDQPGLITSGLRQTVGGNQTPSVAAVTGILTQPQFQVVIHALEQREGTDVLSAPSVTTESGRQAHVGVQDAITIVGGVNTGQTGAGGGVGATGTTGTAGNGVIGSSVNYNTVPFPSGPALDVVPSVSADQFSVQMTILPTLTEFVGYDNPGSFIPQVQSVGGGGIAIPLTAQLPLPHMRIRQVTTSCNVWDGQTVFLGGLISEDIDKIHDKVPFLGDIPFFGKLFQSESSQATKKNLMIFVTPTIIDPAGNRLHTDAELPFAANSIPSQSTTVTPSAAATAK